MNEPPPTDPLPPEPASEYDQRPPKRGGCAFVGSAIGGFIMFFMGGGMAMSVGRASAGTFGVVYLVLVSAFAVWLAFKPAWRGIAVGILLGVGLVLLLIAICGGMNGI